MSRLSSARRAVVGAATVLAAVGSAIIGYTSAEDELIGGIGGLAGGATVFVASILLARTDQRRADKRQARNARDSVLTMLPLPISLSGPSPAVSDASAVVLTTRAPSQLLVADRQAIPRPWGRNRDLARLQAWVQSPNSPTVGILTGPAGVGKTRLTIQLATSLKGSWVTGRLRPRAVGAIMAIMACSEPTLVVIEANGWQPEIAAILDELIELDTANSHPVKVLLVSRHRDWLTYLRGKVRADTAGLIDAAKLLPLDQVGEPEDLLRWYGEARVTFANLLGQPAPPKAANGPPPGATFGDLLSLAYASVVTSNTGVALSTAGEVADVLAEQERLQWPEPDVTISDDLRVRIVAVLILHAVDAEEQVTSVIARIPELSDASGERLRDLTRWAGQIYPGRDWFSMPSLELLTHGLAVPALRDQTLRRSLTSDLDILTLARVSSFLIGAASTYPEAQAWITDLLQPSDLADSLAGLMFGSGSVPAPPQDRTDHLLAALISKITERTTLEELVPVLSHAIGYPRARIALLQAIVAAFRASQDESAARQADLARTLTDLGSGLNSVGRYDEAVTVNQEAVALLGKLAEEHPGRYQPDLAYVLSNLGNVLNEVGRYDEAVTVGQEAVSLLRNLAQEDARHQPELARALSNLGRGLTGVGRYDEAVTVEQEAVSLLRNLAQEDPRHQLNLARVLGNLGNVFPEVGGYDEAVTVGQEAVSLFRKLAQEDSSDQLNLMRTMLNLGNALAEVGRYDEAVTVAAEAVSLLRKLAEEHPARYQPDLARALSTLVNVLTEVGRHNEALTAAQEAISLLRKLAQEDAARHQSDLAYVLSGFGRSLTRAGQYDEAVTVDKEAVSLFRKLAEEHPAGYQPDLARVLRNLGTAFDLVGRYDEAVTVDQEAVALFRTLAEEHPARYQRDLADALNNLGATFHNVRRYDDALTAYKESHALFKALASDQSWRSSDVAKLDHRIRRLLRDLGRDEESVTFAL